MESMPITSITHSTFTRRYLIWTDVSSQTFFWQLQPILGMECCPVYNTRPGPRHRCSGALNNRRFRLTNNWFPAAEASSRHGHRGGFPHSDIFACLFFTRSPAVFVRTVFATVPITVCSRQILFAEDCRRIIRAKYRVCLICLCWYSITKRPWMVSDILFTEEVDGVFSFCHKQFGVQRLAHEHSCIIICDQIGVKLTILRLTDDPKPLNAPLKLMDFGLKVVQVIYFSYTLLHLQSWTFPPLKIHISLKLRREKKKVQCRCQLFRMHTLGG